MVDGIDDEDPKGDGTGNVGVMVLVGMGTKVWRTESVLGTKETEVAAAGTAAAAFK